MVLFSFPFYSARGFLSWVIPRVSFRFFWETTGKMMVEYFPVNSWYASGSLALCSAFRIGDPGR
jgi:hypothetical protein